MNHRFSLCFLLGIGGALRHRKVLSETSEDPFALDVEIKETDQQQLSSDSVTVRLDDLDAGVQFNWNDSVFSSQMIEAHVNSAAADVPHASNAEMFDTDASEQAYSSIPPAPPAPSF